MTTMRVYFNILVCGMTWFTLVSVVYFLYHESTLMPNDSRRAIIVQDVEPRRDRSHKSKQNLLSKDDANSKETKDGEDDKDLYDLTDIDHRVSRYGPGENGQPVRLYGKNEEEAREKWALYNYNIVVSNMISLDRSLKEARDERCLGLSYTRSLPTASVIIASHNEGWTVVMRAVYSIVNRTPADLLKEIILVEDASDDFLVSNQRVIPRKVRAKVRRVYTKVRQGVTRSLMEGADVAAGDVIVFMDSKCEVNRHWLQPLLNVIQKDPATMISPVIDRIDPDTFEYQPSPLSAGIFNWDLGFKWAPLSKAQLAERRQKVDAYRSPVLSGSVFAIKREYLNRLGGLDAGMDGIKASQSAALELSLKVWMCRGHVQIAPCSRVGQISTSPQMSALTEVDESAERRNRVRIAEAWMEEYAKYFYTVLPHALNSFYGNISSQHQVRNKLQCHHFQWYLQNVFPSLLATTHDKLVAWGKCSNKGAFVCLDNTKTVEGKPLSISQCGTSSNTQTFHLTKNGELRWEELCVDLSDYRPGQRLTLESCHGLKGSQEWKHFRPGPIKHKDSDLCLDLKGSKHIPVANRCMDKDSQMWEFMHYERTRRTV